jgi:multidrug efflux system membrane fusion protein
MSESTPKTPPTGKAKWLLLALALCLVAGAGAYWFTARAGGPKKDAAKDRPLPVMVAQATTRDVEVFLSSLGTVTSQNSVTVRSRVDGQLMKVLFREGQMVKAGDLLLLIDSRPYQVQLAQAEGQLKRDRALLENARRDLARYAELMAQGAIARQTYDTQLSLVHQHEGTVAADHATADSARLQITYSRITAPISGQVGLRQVDPGNMVHASDSAGLLVVNQIAPINVVFTLAEDQLPRVLEKLRAGETLRVDAFDREQSRKLAEGTLASMDNQIDTGTGTVRLKAVFKNEGNELYPNQFVNAKLLVDTLKGAVVIPAAAVQRGQQGAYVYVLKDGSTVETRGVRVGETEGGDIVVLEGLAAGEKVVVEGAERLRNGAKVEVITPKAKPAAEAKPAGQPGDAAQANATVPANAVPPHAISANAAPANAANAAKAAPEAAKPSTQPHAAPAKPAAPETAPKAKPAAEAKPHAVPAHAVPANAVPANAVPANAANAAKAAPAQEGQARP